MSYNLKPGKSDVAEYLQSVVKLDALGKITQELDAELEDSQRIMTDINALIQSMPNTLHTSNEPTNINRFRIEDLKFLEGGAPKLLLPDMVANTNDVDIDVLIASMKRHAEDLKNNMVIAQPEPIKRESIKNLSNLNLEQYATSLDQLVKRLANIKLNNTDEINKINMGLDGKLGQLCEDVNMFTQMVQAKTTLNESTKTWEAKVTENNALQYDNIVNKLLAGINEVTYLLQNKN